MKTKLFLMSLLCSGFMNAQEIELQEYANGFTNPVDIAFAEDDRMFVVEQGGLIKMVVHVEEENTITTFLNVSTLISTSSERGLLGMAFHPDFETNGYFFINYTNTSGNTVIARYTTSATDPNVAEPTSAVILMTITQPYSNHNGGCLHFGPDGYLYIGMGDGGSSGDPENRAQNINTNLGKMLRINVDSGTPYSIPDGNPYATTDGNDEIWAIGLRNPWKFSFNRTTGDLWIADVGQGQREEINHVLSTTAGINYGWKCYEGFNEYAMSDCTGISGFTAPVADYINGSTPRCSITGGYVYTGTLFPNLQGKYLFADYCSNEIGILDSSNTITWTEPFDGNNFTTFGEDNTGELYVAGRSSGTVYRILDASTNSAGEFLGDAYTVYPNPADNEVFVALKNTGSRASATIYDIRGKLLVQQEITAQSSRIDTSALGSGIYVMKVESPEGSRSHKLVVR